jgi:DNA repair ATPase RecN
MDLVPSMADIIRAMVESADTIDVDEGSVPDVPAPSPEPAWPPPQLTPQTPLEGLTYRGSMRPSKRSPSEIGDIIHKIRLTVPELFDMSYLDLLKLARQMALLSTMREKYKDKIKDIYRRGEKALQKLTGGEREQAVRASMLRAKSRGGYQVQSEEMAPDTISYSVIGTSGGDDDDDAEWFSLMDDSEDTEAQLNEMSIEDLKKMHAEVQKQIYSIDNYVNQVGQVSRATRAFIVESEWAAEHPGPFN